jgi:hypothetical protein
MFWSDKDARRLIRDHYPKYLNMYDGLGENLQRFDAARYFILYHYGGVYADMDMQSLRPLDKLLTNYSGQCVLAQEPSPEAILLYGAQVIPMNALMICVERHRFMRFVIEALLKRPLAPNIPGATLLRTGPLMLQKVLVMYKEDTKCDKTSPSNSCDVIVAPSTMFIPAWDPTVTARFRKICRHIEDTPPGNVDICHKLKAINFKNIIPKDAYTNHLFLHIGWANGKYKDKVVDISKIVPHVKRYVVCTF